MNASDLLHFSLGPVQGFVAQARRTRDLWAGSFLLSWLSGWAMRAVTDAGGRVLLPRLLEPNGDFVDPLFAAICGRPMPADPAPSIGTLPNRFKAEVPADFDVGLVEKAVRIQWQILADAVWDQFLEPVFDGLDLTTADRERVEAVWTRQIPEFWEMQWVRGPDPGERADLTWLDLRKNWRSHWPSAPEGGDHCTIMGDWQELSGLIRAQERERQDAFWRALRKRRDARNIPLGRLELRDDERLCAIALVKRLFPKLAQQTLREVLGWVPASMAVEAEGVDADDDLIGTASWPSTAYMAAVPWLAEIAEDAASRDAFKRYFDRVKAELYPVRAFGKLCSERRSRLGCLGPLRSPDYALRGLYPDALDGNLLLETALQNARATPLSDAEPASLSDDPDQERRTALLNALGRLYRELGPRHGQTARRPSPVYALLLMDGDHLGRLLRQDSRDVVPAALGAFAIGVDAIVAGHCGKTIYAGGDDVLAILPIDRAFGCAAALRAHWAETMEKYRVAESIGTPGSAVTASAAIVLAHFRLPLRGVLREAHHQLDDIAKAANGRESVAISLLQAGGHHTAWVSTWQDETGAAVLPRLTHLVDTLRTGLHQGDGAVYPRGFFHKLRERYPVLLQQGSDTLLDGVTAGDIEQILLAEYVRTRGGDADRGAALAAIRALLLLCQPLRRDDTGRVLREDRRLRLDAAFIARHMAARLEGVGDDAATL